MFDLTDHRLWCVGRSEAAKPGIDVEIAITQLGNARDLGQSLRPCAIADGERPQFSGFQIFRNIRIGGEHGRHLLAQHGIERLRISRIRNEGDIYFRDALEYFKAKLKAAAWTDARHRDLAWLGAGVAEQFRERPVGRGTVHHDDGRRTHQVADWRKTLEWIEVQLAQ